ncbi:putative bifunctional diguanylate cyclase/phosphodiesterase [Spongisporangium articulatum]|uniref:Bifunctional diguanylate cyclase/phosphodiesterase n=1 Tax=Spongisporangium articulatum TaxID=3362603 RepID=A0ABW8AQ88_9ACTN
MLLDLLLIATATAAGCAWWRAAEVEHPFNRREAQLVVATCTLQGAARVAGLFAGPGVGDGFGVVRDVLLLVAACAVLVMAAGVVRRITALIGGLGVAIAESVLVAASCTTIVWVLAHAPVSPRPSAVLHAAPAMVDLAVLALLLRLSVLVPETLRVGSNRQIFAVASAAVLLLFGGDALAAWDGLAGTVPYALQAVVVLAGGLVSIALTRVPRPPRAADQPLPRVRALPYVLASSAVVIVCVQALFGTTGPMHVVLVSAVVAGLVVLQAFTLRENLALVGSLTASRQRMAALVENTSDLIVRLDANGRVQSANAAAVRLLHRTPASLTGRSFDDLARAEDRRSVREAVLAVTRGRTDSAQVELRLAPPATGTAQLRLRAVPGGAVANLNDVTDSVELRQRLERLARYDHMTGLVNRAHLLEVVGSWLAEPSEAPAGAQPAGPDVVVLYADLDGFKAVNDRFGHGAGDRVLTEVAGRFEAIAGALDARRTIVGRFGGDEFVMGLEGLGPEEAELAARRVVEAISPPFAVGHRTVTLGVSVGVSGAGLPAGRRASTAQDQAAELVHQADLAMYEAKARGRAGVGRWTPELEESARRRVDIAIGLREALDAGRLAVAYQPIVRLADGLVVGAEALLRLPPGVNLTSGDGSGSPAEPDRPDDLVSPAELVAVAEDTGIILEMGEWVLTQAVQQAAEWVDAGTPASVSVNMSVHQLLSPSFVGSVTSILTACGLPPSHLVLELTESQLAGQTGPAVEALERLRAAGVRVAIDDFGTGYSSLSYLRRMPVQLVKLDRTLLDDVGVDPRATAFARSVVSMARDLGLLVVAEGMEELESVRQLRELGAYAGQGFALSPALPPQAMREVLAGPPMPVGARPGELTAGGADDVPLLIDLVALEPADARSPAAVAAAATSTGGAQWPDRNGSTDAADGADRAHPAEPGEGADGADRAARPPVTGPFLHPMPSRPSRPYRPGSGSDRPASGLTSGRPEQPVDRHADAASH